MQEVFRPYYRVERDGRVWSVRRGRYMHPKKNRLGYMSVCLRAKDQIKPYSVHRLVAEEYIPNPDSLPTVDHINGNPSDNRVENLRWATMKMQAENPVTVERRKIAREWYAERRKYGNVNQVHGNAVTVIEEDGTRRGFLSMSSAGRYYGLHRFSIQYLLRKGKPWSQRSGPRIVVVPYQKGDEIEYE